MQQGLTQMSQVDLNHSEASWKSLLCALFVCIRLFALLLLYNYHNKLLVGFAPETCRRQRAGRF